jgi:hypothetical protein
VRLEAAKGSSEAVRLAGMYVIPELRKRGYIKGFGTDSTSLQAPLDMPVAVDEIQGEQGAVDNDTAANRARLAKKPPFKKPAVVKPVEADTSQ